MVLLKEPLECTLTLIVVKDNLQPCYKKATETALESQDGLTLVNDILIPALDQIGKDYETGKIFLPQLIQSAETSKIAFDVIKQTFKTTESSKGPILIATVHGDIHDIEKNIVIPNNGYIKNKTINETIKSKMSQNKTKNKQAIRLKSNTNISTNKISKVNKTENIKVIDNMEISIALKIKKKINKLSNEYDIIESEAYLIKKHGNDKNLLRKSYQL